MSEGKEHHLGRGHSPEVRRRLSHVIIMFTLQPPVPHIFGFSFFISTLSYHILNMLKVKCDINQQYLKTIDLHFVKSE